jgi:hypothetical protein
MYLLSKSWNPSYSTECQSATLLVLGGLPLTVHRDPTLPIVTAGELLCLIKEQKLLTEERKELICTTTRTLQGVTYPAIPSLRNTSGAPEQ